MHKTVEMILRMTIKASPPYNVDNVKNLVEYALSAEMHSLHATVSTTLKATPGVLDFSCDMLFNIPLIVDWQTKRDIESNLSKNLYKNQTKKNKL